ncbi:MAG: 2'-5' RNA ligase family protein [Bacteroidota bacterium]
MSVSKLGFALMPSPALHSFIRQTQIELHETYGFRISRQSPHITIKAPFETTNRKAVGDFLEKLARETKPFPLELKGFGSFGKKFLFVDVLGNPPLKALHIQILNGLQKEFGIPTGNLEGDNIRFHATVAGYEQEADFDQAWEFVQRKKPHFVFPLSALSIFYHMGESGWAISRVLSVGK